MTAIKLSAKHRKTLQAIFASPTQANIPWADIESLLAACGAEITEGQGSRVRIALKWSTSCVSPASPSERNR